MPFRVTKQLLCPSCGAVVASAVHRRWPGSVAVTSVDGTPIRPESVALQLQRARAGAAANPGDSATADRVAFLEDNVFELVFDLPCPNGHSVLHTMPQLARAIRSSPSTSAGEELLGLRAGGVAGRI